MSSNHCTNGCMRLEVGLHMGRETLWHTSEGDYYMGNCWRGSIMSCSHLLQLIS
ncbi:hypothetical protein PAHAL_6G023900 [Panicum hallii]|uniref:Uncharacterized protein n=1 Tax=Panicum hallii TaxID=206008 RepID=A0A2S3I0M5_9POAL|nr:hypothetical protein PAHAL_6G023900 [Panicum hallii]